MSKLPPTSVIICFHNEAWSVLLRTVKSVLDRSPPELISEVILVDDFSDKPHLGKPLEDWAETFDGKVKIVRASKREGLIRARLLGIKASTAPVLTYLDSHCEVCVHIYVLLNPFPFQRDSCSLLCNCNFCYKTQTHCTFFYRHFVLIPFPSHHKSICN